MTLVERLRALVPDGVADDPKSQVIREAADAPTRLYGKARQMGWATPSPTSAASLKNARSAQ